MNLWELPTRAVIGGISYEIHGDFRDILEIFSYLDDPDLSAGMKWRIALALFYEGEIPQKDWAEAIGYLASFIRCGAADKPAPKVLDWEQDAQAIIADVNKVAGQEIRALPFLHWWTFLAYFYAIGEGQLSMLISLREKLRKGQPLDSWEQAYYGENRQKVELSKRYSYEERLERDRLNALLDGSQER